MNYKGVCQKCNMVYYGLYLKFMPETKCVCGGKLEVTEVGAKDADKKASK